MLLDLQAVDTELAQLRHRRASLPEHSRINELLGQRKGILADCTEAETQVSDLELAQAKAESDLEPVKARRIRNQERIDAGDADPKALSGLIDEVAHLTKRIGDLEDAELEVMEALEQAQARLASVRDRRSELEDEIRELMRSRDDQIAEIDRAAGHAQTEREALAGRLPAALVTYYEKIRDKHGGVGAAELRQRRCAGCRLELNAADLRGYAAAAPDEVLRCEECGRILVRTPESGL